MVRIGEAASDENGHITGGKAGDQTGKEVRITNYRSEFTVVYRCKNSAIRNNIAEAMIQMCQNDHYGYSQNDRYSGYFAMMETGNISKVTKDCNVDCSAGVADCCIVAGIPSVSKFMSTSSQDTILMGTGMFEKITKFTEKDLVKGDILWRAGHTAVVVEADTKAVTYSTQPKWVGEAVRYCNVTVAPGSTALMASWPHLGAGNYIDVCDESGDYYYVRIAAVYYGWVKKSDIKSVEPPKKRGMTTDLVFVRSGAGKINLPVSTLKKGTIVDIEGEAKATDGVTWYLVKYGNIKGYVSSRVMILL